MFISRHRYKVQHMTEWSVFEDYFQSITPPMKAKCDFLTCSLDDLGLPRELSLVSWSQNQQDRQCGHYVILRRVRVTNVAMGNHKVLSNMCVISDLSFPACKAHVSYFLVVCAALPCFSTLPHRWYDFGVEGDTEHKMCVLIFSATFVWSISYSR